MLKVDWEQSEPMDIGFRLSLAACKAENLKDLEAVFLAKSVVRDQRIEKIEFFKIGLLIQCVRQKRPRSPQASGLRSFIRKERTHSFCAVARCQSQRKFIMERPKRPGPRRTGLGRKNQKQTERERAG